MFYCDDTRSDNGDDFSVIVIEVLISLSFI